MSNIKVRFTRADLIAGQVRTGKGCGWALMADSADVAYQALWADRRYKDPVRVRTGALMGPHPTQAGWFVYERASKAPTRGNMGQNGDGLSTGDEQRERSERERRRLRERSEREQQHLRERFEQLRDFIQEREQQQEQNTTTVSTDPELAARVAALESTVSTLESGQRPIIEITTRERGKIEIDGNGEHPVFPKVLRYIAKGKNVYLVGPAGSGKTTLAQHVAEHLGLPFFFTGAINSEHKLNGFIDAGGTFQSTQFFQAFTQGGVFLFDEIDGSLANAVLPFNAATANRLADFPCGQHKAHPNFVAIAAANTYGTGADRQYVGRLELDAATRDRFVFVEMDYDPDLERALALAEYRAEGGTDDSLANRWIDTVQRARQNAAAKSVRHVISPRASIFGCAMLADGPECWNDCLDDILYKGIGQDARQQLGVESTRR